MRKLRPGLYLLIYCCSLTTWAWGQNVADYSAIPQPLLFLLREPAVHEHLQLTPRQHQELLRLNEGFDQQLLSSRNKPPQQAQADFEEVMRASRNLMQTLLDDRQRQLLREIRFRVRGISFILDPDVAQQLDLSSDQTDKIQQVVASTRESIQTLRQKLSDMEIEADAATDQARQAQMDEQRQILQLLQPEQQQTLKAMVGRDFDKRRLGRVSFKAPDIDGSHVWLNSEALRLSKLRGKVVALHFWAFG